MRRRDLLKMASVAPLFPFLIGKEKIIAGCHVSEGVSRMNELYDVVRQVHVVTAQDNEGNIHECEMFVGLGEAWAFEKKLINTYPNDWTIGFLTRKLRLT